jgi:hypothetical protein
LAALARVGSATSRYNRISRMIARIAFALALAVPVPLVVAVWMLS